jgi:hypothetical protein
MLRCTVVVSAICSLAFSAAADSGVAALAAPGDCAQPSADYETPPLYQQPAGVSGPAAEHFTPRVDTGSVLGLVPVGLTGTRAGGTLVGAASGTVGLVEGATQTTIDGASGAVDGAGDAIGGAGDAVGGAGDAVGGAGDAIGGAGVAIGSGDLTDSTLTGATGAVDALTNTATGTTSGALGGVLK